MLGDEGWVASCDDVVRELLAQAQFEGPPVDALHLGRRLGITLAWDASQAGRGRLHRRQGGTTILLRPDERPERIQWAAAHELGEAIAWRVVQRVGADWDDVAPRQREQLATEIANRLLIPAPWFLPRVAALDGDLIRLKAEFSTASHELIARRLLDLDAPRTITIWDLGTVSRRQSARGVAPRPLSPSEEQAWRWAHVENTTVDLMTPIGRVRVWPIHEPAWRREIAVLDHADDLTASISETLS